MTDKKNNNSAGQILRDIFIVSLIAAFSGFILGLLFAPESGKKFRKRLVELSREMLDRSRFAVMEARVIAEDIIEKSKGKSSNLPGSPDEENG